MIRFVHVSDIHFGMENYGKIDHKTGIHTRLLDFYDALNFCIDTAISQDVDFFLFAGDAYKTAHPSPTQQRLLFDCFLRLFKANIPIVIVVGNHDNPLSYGKAHALDLFGQLPIHGFHVIARPSSLRIITKRGPIQIVGIPWPSRTTIALHASHVYTTAADVASYMSQAVTTIIEEYAEALNQEEPAVLVAHLTVSSGIFSGSEKRAIYGADPLFMPSHLTIPPFDYVALGHLHRHQNLNPEGTPLVYAGSIERIDFGERKEDKGFCLVTIEDKNNTHYEFIKTPTRPLIQIDTHLETTHSQTEQIIEAIKKHTLEDAILKIVYHLEPGMKDRVDLALIQQACAPAHYMVGIFPIRPPEQRERRLALKVTMHLTELLTAYFQTKPEWKHKQAKLIERALELEAELANLE